MFKFKIGTQGLDIRLSVFCGQVFRWRELLDGRLLGIDGDSWWLIEIEGQTASVFGSGDEAKFRSLFRMNEDWAHHERKVRELAPELGSFLDQLPGLRLLRPTDAIEEAFCFLCTSNNHLSRITAMVDTLASYGDVLSVVEDRTLHRFPSVETIAQIPEKELRTKGFGYRGKTIPLAAQQIVERGGLEWFEGQKAVEYSHARELLLELHGVGPKLADCICLFALGHTEAVPVDTHIWQAGCRIWFPEFLEFRF